ncbi:MAG: T9SS type A sorting domain-containing protein [Bacteroidales bacterium]|nr:T9SS type A sorting domain-containing protein [Bacteroidales bacterium]
MKKTIFLIVLSSLMISRLAMGQLNVTILVNGKVVPENYPFITVCNDSCNNVTLEVTGGTPPYYYKWDNGDTNAFTQYCSAKPSFFDHTNKKLTVKVKDSKSLSNEAEVNFRQHLPINQDICLVSVDSATNKNIIIWEQNTDTIVTFYNIYKETYISNEYELIGSVPKGETNIFIDTKSDPAKKSDKYIIKAANNCTESSNSQAHKPIHLMISGFQGNWNLAWSAYEGYNGSVGRCRIWRGNNYYSMELIDSVSSSVTSYTDINPPAGVVYYAIEVIPKNKCNPSAKAAKGSYFTSLSNIVNNKAILGIDENSDLQNITLSPNPCTDELTINVSHFENVKHLITVYDIHGKAIYQTQNPYNAQTQTTQTTLTINTRSFPPGLYLTRIQSPNSTTTRKFIKF